MKPGARALVLVLGVAACGGRTKVPARPAPVIASSAATHAAGSAIDSAERVDSIPNVTVAISDSALTHQVVAVFGDSAVTPPDSSVPEGPTWDIDVRSYETHRRVEFYVNDELEETVRVTIVK